jgi:hypothetical protein
MTTTKKKQIFLSESLQGKKSCLIFVSTNKQKQSTMSTSNNTRIAFEAGKSYINKQDVLNGLCSGFRVISRTENTLSIMTGTSGKPRNVRIRVTNGHEWVKDSNSPYASAVWA